MKWQIKLIFLTLINCIHSKDMDMDFWNTDDDVVEDDFGFLADIDTNKNNHELDQTKIKVCESPECRILGEEFLKGMNKSVNPCDNFYDFVCGSFDDNYKIPTYIPFWSRSQIFQDTVHKRIKAILETEPSRHDILPVRQAKKWFHACMDIDALDRRSITPIESILMQVGGWPMTIDEEEWNENGHSWQQIEQHYFHITGSYIFYDVIPFGDGQAIAMPKSSIPLNYQIPYKYRNYTADEYKGYMELMEKTVKIFVAHNNSHVTEEMIRRDIQNLIDFEKKIFELSNLFNQKDGYKPGSIDEFVNDYETAVNNELGTNTSKIDFRKIIQSKFDMININMNGSMEIYAGSIKYYNELTKLLNNTPKRTIVNYLHWCFVSPMIVYTTEELRNVFQGYMLDEFGVLERPPRWLECLNQVKLQDAKAYEFVNNYYSAEVEKKAIDMIDNIKKAMERQIETVNWMDQNTKDLATEKLKKIKLILGYPDWFKNQTAIVNSYEGLNIGDDHFENVLAFEKYRTRERWRYAMTEHSNPHEDVTPLEVNARYYRDSNRMELPAADFQPPFFTSELPSVINYGSVGSVIGHEIAHGYDLAGIKYGANGSDTEISKMLKEMYHKRAECFLHQFNNYFGVTEDPNMSTTPEYSFQGSLGRRTREENMADTTGLDSVYKAYKVIKKNPTNEVKLPGFEEYSDDQMFFISFGALYCELSNEKFAKIRKESSDHSPPRLRVIGSVSNSKDFAQAFNCAEGSPMNPENKCAIWENEQEDHTKPKESLKNLHHSWHYPW